MKKTSHSSSFARRLPVWLGIVPLVACLSPAHAALGAEIRTGAGLCLDVHAPDVGNNGGRVQVWPCNGSAQQTWTYDPAARAVRVASGLCLDVNAPEIATNGGRVQVWACTGAPQQQWTSLADGSLRSAGGLCLDVHAPDQTTNGGRVQVWQCNASQQQRFLFGPGGSAGTIAQDLKPLQSDIDNLKQQVSRLTADLAAAKSSADAACPQ